MAGTTARTDHYLAIFQDLAAARQGEPGWLVAARERAAGAFGRLGFPTTRDEDWRFTNVAPIAEGKFGLGERGVRVAPEDLDRFVVPGIGGTLLVFVDGQYVPGAVRLDGLPAGCFAGNLSAALASRPQVERHLAAHAAFDQRSFTSLNTALFEDAAIIEIADGALVAEPIQLLFLSSASTSSMSSPRTLLVAGENSQVQLVETYASLGGGKAFTNAVTELVAGPASVVDYYRLQRESTEVHHVGLTHMRADRSAALTSNVVTLGGHISRHDAVAVLANPGADCTLNGLYVADGARLVDNHTDMDHAMPNCSSHELYKGILGGRARAVFNGRIRVRPDAQKTDAKQTNKTLLLSNEAQINTKPQLEIFANDVRCTHGATVGQLSADALFYLRARGIGRDEARTMLVRAFAGEVVSRMRLEAVRDLVERLTVELLPASPGERAVA